MGQNEFTAWLFAGGGQELYNELLQKELKMAPSMDIAVRHYWQTR